MQKQNREIHSSLWVRSKNKDKKRMLMKYHTSTTISNRCKYESSPPIFIYALHISILVAHIYLCIFVSHKNKTVEKLNNVIDQPLLLHWKKWLHHQPKICRNPNSNISIYHQHLGIQMFCLWIWVHSIRCYDWTVQAAKIWHYQKP